MFLFLSQCDGVFFQQQTINTARIADDDDDDDDDDVQKKACRVLAERAKGEKFLGTFLRVHSNKIFMQQVVLKNRKNVVNANRVWQRALFLSNNKNNKSMYYALPLVPGILLSPSFLRIFNLPMAACIRCPLRFSSALFNRPLVCFVNQPK